MYILLSFVNCLPVLFLLLHTPRRHSEISWTKRAVNSTFPDCSTSISTVLSKAKKRIPPRKMKSMYVIAISLLHRLYLLLNSPPILFLSLLQEVLQRLVNLFSYLQDKDEFFEYFRKALCKRLLSKGKQYNENAEKSFLSKLKVSFSSYQSSIINQSSFYSIPFHSFSPSLSLIRYSPH